MLGPLLLRLSHSDRVRRAVSAAPLPRRVVDRFVPGADLEDVLGATKALSAHGLSVTIDHLGENTLDVTQAEATRNAYVTLLGRLADLGLAPSAEVSVKLSALGQALPDGDRIARDNAVEVCEAAAAAGTTVTLDMEDHTVVDSTLGILRDLRTDFPDVGAVLQAMLRRTEADARDLAYAGSRVRLVKGAYAEPASVAHQGKSEVDLAYVRCLVILMAGAGRPLVATHDPRMIAIAQDVAVRQRRSKESYEFQMLYGIRTTEQRRLAAAGESVRVYIPYGEDWYGYFMRRLAERPANVTFFLRSLVSH